MSSPHNHVPETDNLDTTTHPTEARYLDRARRGEVAAEIYTSPPLRQHRAPPDHKGRRRRLPEAHDPAGHREVAPGKEP
ncbi:hypothetical protein GCM10010289_54790 [Streptomyces violascens]|uniref:Uncharacterized protein n=1 Tax=Streptomyces violascens TaxID=67381 RepID=A0ABQ3QVB0_9ACTN|nr:hypothetical protein GCM10010289_54790 [Streptomyces violascens]GHI41216.1 hypothetical protein Sviol_56240 [Streptomyces violascens]